jgi:glycosyltransferase involved in cell wall biosynthesis
VIDRLGPGGGEFVVPAGIDDPGRPSGGNVYGRRLSAELSALGWIVREHPLPGSWPTPSPSDRERLEALLNGLADGSVVLVDGLIASATESLVEAARRLRVVVLLHMPLAEASSDETITRVEAAVLNAAAAVVTTSNWAREWVITHLGLVPDRVWTARPGVDVVQPAHGTTAGGKLLCVGPITPAKGYDVLIAALAQVADLEWHCTCVGALDLDPEFFESLTVTAATAGLADRLEFPGPLTRAALDDLRSRVNLVVSPSRREAYGMAVAEGLARGIPVIATSVGGHPEAVGRASDGSVPGMLIPADDPGALADALRRWLTDPVTRRRWRHSARLRSKDLASWSETASIVAAALQGHQPKPDPASANF